MFRVHSIIVLHLVLLCWNCLFIYATDTKPTCTDPAESGALFGEQPFVTTNAIYADSVVAADINGDGFLDLASASFSDHKIAWYKNNGPCCPPGQGANDGDYCTPCTPGHYGPTISVPCFSCPTGYYLKEVGKTSCNICYQRKD